MPQAATNYSFEVLRILRSPLAAVSAAALLAGSGEARASGFALREQSGSNAPFGLTTE